MSPAKKPDYTPPPWKLGHTLGGTVCLSPDTSRSGIEGSNGSMQIAQFFGPDAMANARLAGQAHALLEGTRLALEYVQQAIKVGRYTDPDDAIFRQRDELILAIVEATGEMPD
jgi:hypothetical protein